MISKTNFIGDSKSIITGNRFEDIISKTWTSLPNVVDKLKISTKTYSILRVYS
jgi:hypothetical protein